MLTEQIKMTNKARKAAEALAIRYSAYMDANNTDDHNGILAWGPGLLEAQRALGIELISEDLVSRNMRAVRRLRDGA